MGRLRWGIGAVVPLLLACTGARDDGGNASGLGSAGTDSSTDSSPTTMSSGATESGETSGSPTSGASGHPIFDVGGGELDLGGQVGPICKVGDDMNAGGACDDQAPADSFAPDVQWEWAGGPDGEVYSIVTPLVANMTDDNADGEIDLCDVPDIVVVAWASILGSGHIYVLDGETGNLHFRVETAVGSTVTPALGDIDGDGLVEIVTATPGGQLVAFSNDGQPEWTSTDTWSGSYIGALALADLDNDNDVEIIAGNLIFDHTGQLVTTAGAAPSYSATAAADLDGDGDLEVVLGNAVYHHDGSPLWTTNVAAGFPQVADLDDDGLPEVLVTNGNGISLIEHNGTVTYQDLRPTGAGTGANTWNRPATIHDFDGDGRAEYAVSSSNTYTVYEADASILWSAPVLDASGIAAGTAFDFLGDGDAEAMYADESFMFIFDGMGQVLLQTPRTSRTGTEYPVVADVDNDGSAEIVVVSNEPISGGGAQAPAVQVIRDMQDRWIQARRIWNQHTYHVTNVREDGTIPPFEPPSWELLNSFRTNAQIQGGGVCVPDPAG